MENKTTVTTHKKGLLMSSVLILGFITFFFEILIGTFGLIGSSVLGFLSFLFGETEASGVVSSLIQIASGVVGIYGAKLLWKLEAKGLLIFIGALALSIIAKIIPGGIFPTILIGIYAVWILIILVNKKKLD